MTAGNVLEPDSGEMPKPVFTETMQIGIVVRDLDAAVRRYVNDYGISPWKFSEFNPGNATDPREYGKPVKRSWRLATAMIGHVQWELIFSGNPKAKEA
jgi:methylmalonyl-CoA/ethylmalonyl-CoA epimerase